jgi:hypothetical protein
LRPAPCFSRFVSALEAKPVREDHFASAFPRGATRRGRWGNGICALIDNIAASKAPTGAHYPPVGQPEAHIRNSSGRQRASPVPSGNRVYLGLVMGRSSSARVSRPIRPASPRVDGVYVIGRVWLHNWSCGGLPPSAGTRLLLPRLLRRVWTKAARLTVGGARQWRDRSPIRPPRRSRPQTGCKN